MKSNPVSESRYMKNSDVQIPIRLTAEMKKNASFHIEKIDANSSYQARNKYKAAKKWSAAVEKNEYIWLGIAGAATPAGLGGLVADLIEKGLIDVIVSTGANVYHDLHYACGLPVRHGSPNVDDNDLRHHRTTRIYSQFLHSFYTLEAQDMIIQDFSRRILHKLKQPFSTATFTYKLGIQMLNDNSGIVVDKKGSFMIKAAEHGVPIFLDSGSNHSLGMNLSLLFLEGYNADTSPSRDVLEASALSINTQPQLNVFLGEGGPRNFIQTTAPTASEICGIPFEGSDSCIRFTTADERTGSLSGSTQSEAVSWGKYSRADPTKDIEVWGDYTLTAPDVMAYVAEKVSKKPRRLIDKLEDTTNIFIETVKNYKPKLKNLHAVLREELSSVIKHEVEARKKAGYKFD